MKKTCDTCKHRRDFKVIGVEVFPSICKAPTAKKHDFALRFTEVMRRDGWLKAWLFNTCGKRGRWWEESRIRVSDYVKTDIKNAGSLDPRNFRTGIFLDNLPDNPPTSFDKKQSSGWFEESKTITPQQWESLTKSIDDFKNNRLPKPVRQAPPMPKCKPPKQE